MITRIENFKEYHSNGQLRYSENRAYLSKASEALYSRRIKGETTFIRVGMLEKYHDNGILEWSLEFDNMGEVVNGNNGFRKDGTPRIL